MFDEARSLLGMIKMRGATQKEIAKALGVSQSYVANKLRLLSFTKEERERITSAALTERHARALLRLTGEARARALETTAKRGLNVRECEALVDFLHDGEAPRIIGRALEGERIKKFTETLEESVVTLRSLGIDASIDRTHHGRKLYLTVCIAE